MRTLALLTLAEVLDYVIDDAIAVAELERRGWHAVQVPWTDLAADWRSFDAIIVRTTWDYHHQPERFLEAIDRISAQTAHFANPAALIRWNLDKRYLRDLEAKHVPIVPSVWGIGGEAGTFRRLFDALRTDEIVVKPTVSANAMDTFRLRAPVEAELLETLVQTYADRSWFAQPFLHSILSEGEYSVFYFGGQYSHCIRKVPARGDFRVQEEHGGEISGIELPNDVAVVAARVMAALAPAPLQARVDLARLDDGSLALMELELIEPSLYFRTHPDAARNFADAVEHWVRGTPPPITGTIG
jgi:glutathione synthase/RimK-type ligase-like ATP-grasp enzyme